jgi:hypothetical protein
MWRVVTGMTSTYAAQARTALSPEWDHGFDEAFTDLVTNDPDWVRDEFDALIGANFTEPPQPPAPPAPSTDQPQPPPEPADHDQTPSNRPDGSIPADPQSTQRSPP